MADSNNLLCELERAVKNNPQFHITRVMHNISKVDEYMPDEEAAYVLKKLVDSNSEDENMFFSAEFWDGMYRAYENRNLNLLTKDQATEIFHEWMQKSSIIIDNWNGVLYDDGTAEVFENVKNYFKNK